jgi:hypothetical protein
MGLDDASLAVALPPDLGVQRVRLARVSGVGGLDHHHLLLHPPPPEHGRRWCPRGSIQAAAGAQLPPCCAKGMMILLETIFFCSIGVSSLLPHIEPFAYARRKPLDSFS